MYKPACSFAKRLALAALLSALFSAATAADDLYRAEIILLERLTGSSFVEQMAHRTPQVISEGKRLWVVNANGERLTDLKLTSPSSLTLNAAANRLESSGKYRVLMRAGWVERFPPNYRGEPLRVEVGDMLQQAGHREVEGIIKIDRERFLHVNVELNHWRAARGMEDVTSVVSQFSDMSDDRELITWIRETRRMRSEEIHYLDSPTLGVLVLFRKLD